MTREQKLTYHRAYYAKHREDLRARSRENDRRKRAKRKPVREEKANRNYDDLRICNCAECDCELATEGQEPLLKRLRSNRHNPSLPRLLAGRIQGRPFCVACLNRQRNLPPNMNR